MEDYSSISTTESVPMAAEIVETKASFITNPVTTHAATGIVSALVVGAVGYFFGRKKGGQDVAEALNEEYETVIAVLKADRAAARKAKKPAKEKAPVVQRAPLAQESTEIK